MATPAGCKSNRRSDAVVQPYWLPFASPALRRSSPTAPFLSLGVASVLFIADLWGMGLTISSSDSYLLAMIMLLRPCRLAGGVSDTETSPSPEPALASPWRGDRQFCSSFQIASARSSRRPSYSCYGVRMGMTFLVPHQAVPLPSSLLVIISSPIVFFRRPACAGGARSLPLGFGIPGGAPCRT